MANDLTKVELHDLSLQTHKHPKGAKYYSPFAGKWYLWHSDRWLDVLPRQAKVNELERVPDKPIQETMHGEAVSYYRKPTTESTDEVDRGAKYLHTVCNKQGESIEVDIYDVLRAWNVTDPAQAHGLKKQLQPGLRGSKSVEQDLEEGLNSLQMHLQHVKQGVAG
jgi:hypothetical protein